VRAPTCLQTNAVIQTLKKKDVLEKVFPIFHTTAYFVPVHYNECTETFQKASLNKQVPPLLCFRHVIK
jgi:hypothetical protein